MATVVLAPKELELLGAVLEAVKSKINWQLVAKEASFPNAKKARDKWYALRKKLLPTAVPSSVVAGQKRKREEDHNDSSRDPPSSSKLKDETAVGH